MKANYYGIRVQMDLFRLIVESGADGIVVVDRSGIVRFLNPAAAQLFKRPKEQMVGEVFGFPIQGDKPQELDIVRPGKDTRVAEMRVVEMELCGETLYLANLRDISELVRLREDLRALSFVDELTGLYNRRGFLTLSKRQLMIARRTKRRQALGFVDFDGLKGINDNFGHQEGDNALRETAHILRSTFRGSDIVARLGGDEFAVLALEVQKNSADVLSAHLQKRIHFHNTEKKHRYTISVSMGIAYYDPYQPCTIDRLLKQADARMYRQKQRKRI